MSKLFPVLALLFISLQTLSAQTTIKLFIDGEPFDGQSFEENSIVTIQFHSNCDSLNYRFDKISIEVKLEEGGTKMVKYKKKKFFAREQSENGVGKQFKVYEYPTQFSPSPAKQINLADFEKLNDLCVSKIIIQVHKISYLNKSMDKPRKLSSKYVDYSNTYSLWANWSCLEY